MARAYQGRLLVMVSAVSLCPDYVLVTSAGGCNTVVMSNVPPILALVSVLIPDLDNGIGIGGSVLVKTSPADLELTVDQCTCLAHNSQLVSMHKADHETSWYDQYLEGKVSVLVVSAKGSICAHPWWLVHV